jgi:Zn-finger protein
MQLRSLVLVLATAGVTSAVDLGPLSSAELCGRCHRAILDAWKTSAHARAMESPLFQQGLERTEADFGADAQKKCLGCHSPISVLTGDRLLRQKVSWEGVTCDYCHSIRGVSTAGVNPKAKVEFSLIKSGPLKDVVAPVHGAEFSPVHTSSDACAPCHEYRNSLGLPVLTTFSEWKKSRYGKEGKTCQSCHMYRVAGNVVDPKVKKSSVAKVNLHQMPGSHSLDQLNKTIKARLTSAREGDQLKVSVEMANVAAGHYVPTGSPMRQLIMEVRADSYDGKHFREVRRYRRTVADRQGKRLTLEPAAFLKGAKVLSDTRLAPDEKRTETFTFPIPQGVQTQVRVALRYYYSPLAETESQKRVTFRTIRRLVR